MSATSLSSPVQHKDIRSASRPFKRDKDRGEKWSNGQRPSGGVGVNYSSGIMDDLQGGSESQRAKVRPMKQWSQMTSDHKSHSNCSPKNASLSGVSYNQAGIHSRITKKVDALIESTSPDPLSKSLLDLLPKHYNNTEGAVQVMGDEGILYSFDKRPSPNARGREVDLGGLVEKAERKWAAEQTERIVRGEYEVLDLTGEAVKNKKGKKGSRSPKNRAVKNEVVATPIEEVDGFELV